MNILLNGQKKSFEKELPLRDLIEDSSNNTKCIIAEVNGTIIQKPAWPETRIQDGDTIELVTFVGGG